jgi:hypothetical protein
LNLKVLAARRCRVLDFVIDGSRIRPELGSPLTLTDVGGAS